MPSAAAVSLINLPSTGRPGSAARLRSAVGLLPGIALCGAVATAAMLLQQVEAALFGRAWLEALVLAILVGTLVRTAWSPGDRWMEGIAFSAKTLLEAAVVLLGASLSAATVVAAGPALLLGIVGVVIVAVAAGYGMGRLLGLPPRMATLVACGNAICGNSAIAAVAPVIGAEGEEVSVSIAFTAVLGVPVVLGLPVLAPLLHMGGLQYGALAGLKVYAVPQVLAATAPAGALAVQFGTLVKLVRVMMLCPVVLTLALLASDPRAEDHPAAGRRPAPGKLPLHKLVPWFILGFLALAALRSAGALPQAVLAPTKAAANWLTILSMAALGLCTDLCSVARAGERVSACVVLCLIMLGMISFGLIRGLGIA